jgi:hypothetical protein
MFKDTVRVIGEGGTELLTNPDAVVIVGAAANFAPCGHLSVTTYPPPSRPSPPQSNEHPAEFRWEVG